jgi:phage gp29-like protein
MDALGKSYSVTEILWDFGDKWVPRALKHVDPRWFFFDKATGQELRLKSDATAGEELTPGKYVVHRARFKSGLPIRGGLARAACWAYLFQNFALRDWVQFIETFGKPLRLGRYEGGVATPADIDILIDAVQSLGTDAAAVLPKSMLIEFPEVQNARGDNQLWRLLLEYLDRQISKLVLGQTLTADTGESGGGSYALGGVHNEVRMDILADDAKALADTINRDLVRVLVNLNFAGVTDYPRYELRVEEPEDLTALVAIVEKGVAMGQPVSTKWFSEKFGIPLPEEGEETLGRQEAPTNEGSDAPSPAVAANKATPPKPPMLKANVDRLAANAAPAMKGWLEKIEAMLAAADSLEEFREMLATAYTNLDTDVLAAPMAMAMTAMALAGKYDVEDGNA